MGMLEEARGHDDAAEAERERSRREDDGRRARWESVIEPLAREFADAAKATQLQQKSLWKGGRHPKRMRLAPKIWTVVLSVGDTEPFAQGPSAFAIGGVRSDGTWIWVTQRDTPQYRSSPTFSDELDQIEDTVLIAHTRRCFVDRLREI